MVGIDSRGMDFDIYERKGIVYNKSKHWHTV